MKEQRKINIDDILNSLDDTGRAEASPYLYSKVMNRLQQPNAALSTRLSYRLVFVLALVAVLNVLTIRAVSHSNATEDARADVVAKEYSISLPATY